jgi:hypothetical protein
VTAFVPHLIAAGVELVAMISRSGDIAVMLPAVMMRSIRFDMPAEEGVVPHCTALFALALLHFMASPDLTPRKAAGL